MPPDSDGFNGFHHAFPDLPILSATEARRSERERFGGLYWLGIGGLIVVVGLLCWFAWSVWSMRSVWENVYNLHDEHATDARRIVAAYALGHDPRVNQRQLWDMSLSRTLPSLARYVLAEGLTAEAASADPRGYALAVARSEGWPVWLRLALVRPLAYRAVVGGDVDREPLEELAKNPDRATSLWATYALAASHPENRQAADALRATARVKSPEQPLVEMLESALDANTLEDRTAWLNRASQWMRGGHPEVLKLWDGWNVRDGILIPPERPAGP
jgi:hypothetical protein